MKHHLEHAYKQIETYLTGVIDGVPTCYTIGACSLWYPNGAFSPWRIEVDAFTSFTFTVLDFSTEKPNIQLIKKRGTTMLPQGAL